MKENIYTIMVIRSKEMINFKKTCSVNMSWRYIICGIRVVGYNIMAHYLNHNFCLTSKWFVLNCNNEEGKSKLMAKPSTTSPISEEQN